MSKQVIIMSGVSGSGKSTYARKLASNQSSHLIVSADDYFTDAGKMRDGGGYHFDPKKLSDAHADCFRRFLQGLQRWHYGIDLIIVDNTNLTVEEISPYILGAQAFFQQPKIITIWVENTADNGKMLAHRNSHGVPEYAIRNQMRKMYSRKLPMWWHNTNIQVEL